MTVRWGVEPEGRRSEGAGWAKVWVVGLVARVRVQALVEPGPAKVHRPEVPTDLGCI